MDYHLSVMLNECVEGLNIRTEGTYVDATFGGGGHSRAVLSHLGDGGRLLAFDQDADAQANAIDDPRFTLLHENFRYMKSFLRLHGVRSVDGILADLGVSSHQFDAEHRGFSIRFDCPLDMRMDTTRGQTAAQWLAVASENDIHEIIKEYGEERFSRQIARAIVQQREETPILTTHQLANIAAQCVRTREKGQDPATRTFQAIRIFINRELDEVREMLPQVVSRLNVGGRLAVIAFHSLEDRLVKQFMRTHSTHAPLPKWATIREADLPLPPLKTIGKAVKPSAIEIDENPRARSAVLRIAERTTGEFRQPESR